MCLSVKLSTSEGALNNHDLRAVSGLLPATHQTVGAAIVGEGDSSRAPSRSALSAALFAACLASRSDDAAAVLRLLEIHGGGIADVWDENGRTPLHHVCRADDVGLAQLLCRAGADTAAQDCQVRQIRLSQVQYREIVLADERTARNFVFEAVKSSYLIAAFTLDEPR